MSMKNPEGMLRATLAEARTQRAKWDAVVEALEKALGEEQLEIQPVTNGGGVPLSSPALAELVLQDANRPLHMKHILARIRQRGVQIDDPRKYSSNLYSNMMKQPKRFRRTAPNTFDVVREGVSK